jgi:hypothetical protein
MTVAASMLNWVAHALADAWPGVAVSRAEIAVHGPQDSEPAIAIEVSVSGECAALVACGVVTEEELQSLPPCGVGWRSGRSIKRSRNGRASVTLHAYDPPRGFLRKGSKRFAAGSDTRNFDLLVSALAPSVWRPPSLTS